MTLRRGLLYLIGLAASLLGLACLGFGLPGDIALTLVAGWGWFIARSAENVTIDWPPTAMGAVSLILLAFALHRFLYSLYPAIVRNSEQTVSTWRPQWTLAAVSVVMLMFCAGISLIAITHQIAWIFKSKEPFIVETRAREPMRRSQSKNNLKQIGLALHNYHDVASALPPGGTFDANGRPWHSWQTYILPFVDQAPLYNQINFNVAWDDSRNTVSFRTKLPAFWNPGVRDDASLNNPESYGSSHYAASGWVMGGNVPLTFRQFTDGLSNTILTGEAAGDFKPWGDPTNWRDPQRGINKSPQGFGSTFIGGCHFLMGDGAVRFVSENIDPKVLHVLSTPAGGESMDNVNF